LFAGSLGVGQTAAAVMNLVRSVQLNGLDPHAYLKDVLARLPTPRDSAIRDLLPHRWTPANNESPRASGPHRRRIAFSHAHVPPKHFDPA
jgi:hypothetical protein